MPQRIQLRRSKGWTLPANTLKVDRSTRWGNPYRPGDAGIPDAATAVARMAADLESDAVRKAEIRAALQGRNLACWCPLDGPCHADLLLRIANDE